MSGAIIINSTPAEVRVALLENNTPVEVYFEKRTEMGVQGKIYKGKVVRVLPGMQAAFVDIGLSRTGFLYVNDALPQVLQQLSDEASEEEKEKAPSRLVPAANISDVLRVGQELLLQVVKEPLGTKGARVTRHITVPGRCLVWMPFSSHVGVSHRITHTEERDRLKKILTQAAPKNGGCVARTAAEGVSEEDLIKEASMLVETWHAIQKDAEGGNTPRLVYSDVDLVLKTTRDLFREHITRIVVDNADDAQRLRSFIGTFSPSHTHCVEYYDKHEPIFDHFGIDVEINRALERQVWLKSGAYIVIDQAEALTAIDVNSGRCVGKKSLEDTVTAINLEAVKEICYQLRLRNIGGIIIVDFIDMALSENHEKVMGALKEALSYDRAKTAIVQMSELGLVEMTRKRTRDSIGHLLTQACPYCRGKGAVQKPDTVSLRIVRDVAKQAGDATRDTFLIYAHPDVTTHLCEGYATTVEHLEQRTGAQLLPVSQNTMHHEEYSITRVPHKH
jgi:ribonuclease G